MSLKWLFSAVLVACVTFSASAARAAVDADGCDPAVFQAMTTNSNNAVKNMDTMVKELFEPPKSILSYECARNNFNIWDTSMFDGLPGMAGLLADAAKKALDALGIGDLLSGFGSAITLTESSPFSGIIDLVRQEFFNSIGQISQSQRNCNKMWTDTIGNAMKDITFNPGNLGVVGFGFGDTLQFNLRDVLNF